MRAAGRWGPKVRRADLIYCLKFRLWNVLFIAALCFIPGRAAGDGQPDEAARRQQLVDALRRIEVQSGIAPTGNFAHADPRVPAYYRCYFTGPLELPDSYSGLRLREGTKDGCSIDRTKYDVFFYPIEAVASGNVPITQALETASDDRVSMVVPHEDFHSQVEGLPDPFAEAAATLVGFLTAGKLAGPEGGTSGGPDDAALFLRKADLVNRYYEQLKRLYRGVRDGSVSKGAALERKRLLFAALDQESSALTPPPRSFNNRVSAANNAGLAFDHTYTQYYPLLYRVFLAEGRELRATVAAISNAPKTRREARVERYFAGVVRRNQERESHSPR